MVINILTFLFMLYGTLQPIAVQPLDGDIYIYQKFSYREGGHIGLDYKTPVGTPVHAIQAGVVILALENNGIYGRSVMILHPDRYVSLYAHLSKINVAEGDPIKTGKVIGLSGGDPGDYIDGDGQSKGAHLHLEIRTPTHLDDNQHNIDPSQYLNSLIGLPPLSL